MGDRGRTRGFLRHVPNALSLARVLAVPVLVVLAARGREAAFTWVLVPALLSDIADGWIARALALESPLGALLDSVGDTLLWFVSVYGVWRFHREVIDDHALLCGVTIGLWALEYVLGMLRYGRLSSFHTYLSKIAGYLLGIYLGVLFVFGHHTWLLYLACGASILGNVEEFILLAMLPQWRADVGGVRRVLRERSQGPVA